MQIVIVGVGALGSHLVQFLRSEDIRIHVVDFDRVETHNLKSQFHGLPHRGRLKVDSLKQTSQFLWGMKLTTNSARLVLNNMDALLGNADLLVDCLDNAESRRLVQIFAWKKDIPCVHGALAEDGSFGRVCWTDTFVIDEGGGGRPTCEDGAFLPFITLTASYLALAIQEYIRHGRKIGYQVAPTAAFRT